MDSPANGSPATQVTVPAVLPIGPEMLWLRLASADTLNAEMAPWLRLTGPVDSVFTPAALDGPLDLGLRGPAGLPLGGYPLHLVRIEAGKGFVEQTRLLGSVLWQHRRELRAVDTGATELTDSLGWTGIPRLLTPAMKVLVRGFLRHRHRRLGVLVGGRSSRPGC